VTTVTVTGVGMTRHGRLDCGPRQLASEAICSALADAEIQGRDVGMVFVSNALGETLCDQASIRGQSWLRELGLGTTPIVNIENACAGGASALHMAWLAANAGVSPVVALGVEKMWTGDRALTLKGIEGSLPEEDRPGLRVQLGDGDDGPRSGSLFMALNAAWARRQLEKGWATIKQFAAAAVKARRHGSLNPFAQHRDKLTVDEVLNSPPVAGPLTRLMCSSFTDGASAAVISASDAHTGPRVMSSVLASGDGTLEYHDRLRATAVHAWEQSGIGPRDVDVVEVHDATSAEELYALESLDMFDLGDAGAATERGETTFGGRVVVNPSGGLVARGHPLGATGLAQLVELVLQLRGDAGDRQAQPARTAAMVNTGGIVADDAASIGVHVLAT